MYRMGISILFYSISVLWFIRVQADLFVILLQSSDVLPSLSKLPLLHALPHVPVDEGSLGVHQVKLVIQPGPGLSNGGGVGEHADGAGHLGHVAPRHHGGRLVVDADLEASRTPVHELDSALVLDVGDPM